MVKLIVNKTQWDSETANRTWTISEYDDGSYACSCPAWIFQKGGIRKDCKHIKAFLENSNQREQYVTATIQSVSNKVVKELKDNCDTMGGIEIQWEK